MKTRILAASVLAFGLAFAAFPASAGFIAGAFSMSGDLDTKDGASLAEATGFTIPWNEFRVQRSTLDFAESGVTRNVMGSINDFTFRGAFDPFVLWTVEGFTYTIESFRVMEQSSDTLHLTGVGMVSGNGYIDTVGYWGLVALRTGDFYSFTAGISVPEPATVLLIGLGLVGFAARRRRR